MVRMGAGAGAGAGVAVAVAKGATAWVFGGNVYARLAGIEVGGVEENIGCEMPVLVFSSGSSCFDSVLVAHRLQR